MERTELEPTGPARKPRIALMGEFSAGKSTLANILMGKSMSPIQATATQVPPLWYAKGDGPSVRIGADGTEEPVTQGDLHSLGMSDTLAVRMFGQADILDACDIIDMPGSSDPNIRVDIWGSVLPLADAVIWCTPATQAWRQSEAALWEEFAGGLGGHSLLLVTRIDKILNEADRHRLLGRLNREVGESFRRVLPVSLTEAQKAGEERSLWQSSGMEAIMNQLLEVVVELEPVIANKRRKDLVPLRSLDPQTSSPSPSPSPHPSPREAADDPAARPVARMQRPLDGSARPARVVAPKRVASAVGMGGRRPRPRPDEVPDSLI